MGLYEIVIGLEKAPEETQEQDYKKWRLKDAKAQEALITRMDDEPLLHVMQCANAHEMWQKLESVYDRKSNVSLHLLNEQFYSLKFENESVNSFITRVLNISAKLKQLGEEIPKKMLMTKIIMSLPEKFKYFRSAWESVPEDRQDINNLTARLLIEEERIGKEKEETMALLSKRSDKKCFTCGKIGHMKAQCRKNIECFHCKKRGHYMKDCYLRKKKENQDQGRGNRNDSNRND